MSGSVRPFVGQRAHVHADVDERLQAEPQPEPDREIRSELQARVLREPRDVEAAPHEADEQRERQHHAHEAQLFGQHREQEVRVRFRQIEQLLHAAAEADAEPFTAADGDERLRELEAAVLVVTPTDRGTP